LIADAMEEKKDSEEKRPILPKNTTDYLECIVASYTQCKESFAMTNTQTNIIQIFAEALGGTSEELASRIFDAELKRLVQIKCKNATLSELNEFYSEVANGGGEPFSTIDSLVANFSQIDLDDVENESLVRKAMTSISLRFNNCIAYKLTQFIDKSNVELIFYVDQEKSDKINAAWIGASDHNVKELKFENISQVNENIDKLVRNSVRDEIKTIVLNKPIGNDHL